MDEYDEVNRKVFLNPEDFPRLISHEQLREVLDHQENAFTNGTFEEEPFPQTEDPALLAAYSDFACNRQVGFDDDTIEAALDSDKILEQLIPSDRAKTTPERTRLVRIRSSVVAAQQVLFGNIVTLEIDESSQITEYYKPQVA